MTLENWKKCALGCEMAVIGIGVSNLPLIRFLTDCGAKVSAHDKMCIRDRGILETAMNYGFSSNEAFTRALKDSYGITPSEYRKMCIRDRYWDRALKEMNAVEPNISITKSTEFSAPHVKCMDLYFDGTRNGRVYAKLLIPTNLTGKAPAVLHFHGYSGNTGDWTTLLSIASAGFIVAAMDCRGQGGKSSDKNPVEGNTLHGHIRCV